MFRTSGVCSYETDLGVKLNWLNEEPNSRAGGTSNAASDCTSSSETDM